MYSYPANSLAGPLLYLASSIRLPSLESVVSENLRQHCRQRVAGEQYRRGIFNVAADSVELKHAATQIGDVTAELELVGSCRGVVLTVATELPECFNPELPNVNTILQRRGQSAVFGIADAAGCP
jgi:hypothetical protein